MDAQERAQVIADLRAKLATTAPQPAPVDVLALHPPLSGILPGGGLPRQAVTQVQACPALVVEILGQVTAAGRRAAVVGWSELAYAAVADSGGDLERLIAVPNPGGNLLAVTAMLCEGLDLVVCHSAGGIELTPTQMRPIGAKLRAGSACLLGVGVRVPSPALRLHAHVAGIYGLGRGSGRITGMDVEVSAFARGIRTGSTTLHLGTGAIHERPALKAI